jgi:hypothetical protein
MNIYQDTAKAPTRFSRTSNIHIDMLKLLACPFSKPFHLRRAYCLRKFSTCPSIRSSKTAQVESHQPAKTKVIFSGIQPTGTPHLGNYLGALRQWVQLQQDADPETELIYCIVDLHAITTQQDRDQLRRWKRETMGMLLALGLDPTRSTIFYQSDVCTLHLLNHVLTATRCLLIVNSCGS